MQSTPIHRMHTAFSFYDRVIWNETVTWIWNRTWV